MLGHPRARLPLGPAASEGLLPGAFVPLACTMPQEKSYDRQQVTGGKYQETVRNVTCIIGEKFLSIS